jgi:hypothetical protein
MIDVQEKKSKIISFLETSGPSLPVRIAKTIEMDPVFASALLSELLSSKQLKTSHMKIGASPLYLLPGQENQLEKQSENLKSAEQEALVRLKEKIVITDEDENPTTRVALRNIKDFAIPFKFKEKIMWKYAFSNQEEINKLLNPKEEEEKKEESIKKSEEKPREKIQDPEKEIKTPEPEVPKAWEVKKEEIKKIKKESHKPYETQSDKKQKKKVENIFIEEEPEPEFLTEIKNFLERKNIKFLEEIRTEKKEIMATVEITSQLGNINFLLIAKNKKTATKDEINAAIQIATKNSMPCLLIIRKTPSKPIQKIIDENHLIKLEIIN